MRKITNRKASFNMLIEFILIVAVVSIVAVLVFELNDDARTQFVQENTGASCARNSSGGTAGTILYDNCGAGYNSTIDADEAVAKIPTRLPLLATAVIFGVVIWVILRVIPIKLTGNASGF